MRSTKVPRFAVLLMVLWIVFIIALFFDPLTPALTDTHTLFSPFRLKETESCFLFQGQCLPPIPYALGARLFWGLVIPAAVVSLLLSGPRIWRQVCPLAWIVQLPRILGLKPKQQHMIASESWLNQNFPYFTFGLFFLGLNLRLLFVNSDRLGLGIVLLLITSVALVSGFWFGGRTWCNYFCPMIGVEMIYMGAEGVFGTPTTRKGGKGPSTLCQGEDSKGRIKSACVGCSNRCIDLYSNRVYWQQILHPGMKWLYYGYIGLIIGFFGYFTLYSGNPAFLKSGTLWLETHQLKTLFQPGLYLFGQAIPVPKILAVPLVLGLSVLLAHQVGCFLERRYKRLPSRRSLSPMALQHHCYSFCTFLSFNLLFFLGVQPSLGWLPSTLVNFVSWFLVVMTTFWFGKALRRTVPSVSYP